MATDIAWLDRARADLGLREIPGAQHSERILEMGRLADVGWKVGTDEIAWCATAMNAWLVEAGQPSTHSALARSFTRYGRRLAGVVPGAIVVFPRGSNPVYGHVGVVERVDGNRMTIINGNVSDSVRRSVRRVDEVLPDGIRWPPNAPLPDGTLSREATPAPRYELGERTLDLGDEGADVREWQKVLNEFGYRLDVDGVYGPATRDATVMRQRRAGIREDGIAGPATVSATLTDLKTRQAQKAKADEQAKGGTAGGVAGGVGGAAIGVGGTAVAIDQGADAAGKVKELLSPGVGEIIMLVAILALAGFALWWFVIRPRLAERAEVSPRETRTFGAEEWYEREVVDDLPPLPRREEEMAG